MNKTPIIIFLVGMPGVGKTFFGAYAAKKLGFAFVDLDELIIQSQQKSIAAIFKKEGEEVFRQIESKTLEDFLANCKVDTIMATGGGTPCFMDGIQLMNEHGITVWLDASTGDILKNMEKEISKRPLFVGLNEDDLINQLEEMYSSRIQFYVQSRVKLNVYRGLRPDLFTKRLHLSTIDGSQ